MSDQNEKRIKVMDNLINNYKNQIISLKSTNDELLSNVEELSNTVKLLRTKIIKNWCDKGYKESLVTDNIELSQDNNRMIRKVKKMDKEIISLKSDIAFLKIDNENSKKRIIKLEESNLELLKKNEELDKKNEELDKKNISLNNRIDVLELKILDIDLLNGFSDLFRYFKNYALVKKIPDLTDNMLYTFTQYIKNNPTDEKNIIAEQIISLGITMDDYLHFVYVNRQRNMIHRIDPYSYDKSSDIITFVSDFYDKISAITVCPFDKEKAIKLCTVVMNFTKEQM